MDSKFIYLRQVAAEIPASTGSLRRWIHAGRLPAYMVGGRIVIRKDDLAAFIRPVAPRKKGGTK